MKHDCYFNRFQSDPLLQCPRPGTHRRHAVGNPSDAWTWCLEHAGPGSYIITPDEEVDEKEAGK